MRMFRVFLFMLLIFCGLLDRPAPSWAGSDFVLDGRFDDWRGRAFLSGDQSGVVKGKEFKNIYWGTNENERNLYFMIEMQGMVDVREGITCRLFFDINGNGHYEDRVDRYAELDYKAGSVAGDVEVKVYTASGDLLSRYHGNWGDRIEDGGKRFEFFTPMDQLGIYPAQPVRFYLSGMSNSNRLPSKGDNQWMPFPVMVKDTMVIAAVSIIWLAGVIVFRRHRIWIFYYIWGAVGFTFLLILYLRGSIVEYQLEHYTGFFLHHILQYLEIKTYVFDKAPGTLLVLIEVEKSWTTIDIDIESSGLLEMCIFLGLVLFYPPYGVLRKVTYSLVGIISIYAINLLRLMIIIITINWGGRDMIFIAHTLLGRLVFFILIIALYWHIFTRPSLVRARERVEND